ncbi:MAG: WG repeat-containing protein [Deltaproteobacteria bacterium]|nr:MAG: WG repeat-containing protein [Deltaproteobacteria bacterium]
MHTYRSFAALLTAAFFVLACAGVGTAPVDAPPTVTASFSTTAPHLIQNAEAVWTPDGELLVDLGGSPFDDLYIIDTSRAASFLLNDAGGVHVLHREGAAFTVKKVRDDGIVERPIGDVALVRFPGNGRAIVGLDGDVIREGVWIRVSGNEEPPVDQPEYWWTLDYFSRPAPVCDGDRSCGWIGPTGDWLFPPKLNSRPPFYLTQVRDGGGPIVGVDGSVIELDVSIAFAGPPSEGIFLASRLRPEAPRRTITHVRTVDGEVLGTVEGEVLWDIVVCPSFRGIEGCNYVFHQERAAVLFREAGLKAAYLAPDASVVIGPDNCEQSTPSGPFHDDRAFHCVGEEHWLIDRAGQRIAGPWQCRPITDKDKDSYPNGLFFSEGRAAVPVEGGWAYIDTAGEVVLPGPYRKARPFRLGIAAVTQGDEWIYIDRSGKPLFEPRPAP